MSLVVLCCGAVSRPIIMLSECCHPLVDEKSPYSTGVALFVFQTLSFYFPSCGTVPPPVIMVQNVNFRYNETKVGSFSFSISCSVLVMSWCLALPSPLPRRLPQPSSLSSESTFFPLSIALPLPFPLPRSSFVQ